MVDLKKNPYFLTDKQIDWVKRTISEMTLSEKLGQLFVLLKNTPGVEENQIRNTVNASHLGGLRWMGGNREEVYLQNCLYQKASKVPLFIAVNCDSGGDGALPEGTFVATAAQAGAGNTKEIAYHMGLVAGKEAGSVGCNWFFNPVCDILMNWRNSVVNSRSFSGDAEKVLTGARAYIRGVREASPHIAVCAKHFPGDGVEELDQHLALGINNLSVEEWENSFGKVYRTLIEEGLDSIMVGHIALPEMSRKLRPGIENNEILPATLAPELITDLLREKMGFNGVVITDATHMIGMTSMMRREDALPQAIAAGCDMLLFVNDLSEDLTFLQQGYEKGIITNDRLNDALHRILGLKAKLYLYEDKVRYPNPDKKYTDVGLEEYRKYARDAADSAITLVKDTRHYLPLDPRKQKRAYLVYVGTTPTSIAYKPESEKQVVIEELKAAGFEVDVCPDFHELELEKGASPMNSIFMMDRGKRKDFIEKYDVVFLVLNVNSRALENNIRIRWSAHHSRELPWYIPEVPTIGISLSYTNLLIDVPQVHTFINAYKACRTNIRATIEKICGKSSFRGTAEDTVFCGRWDTRL